VGVIEAEQTERDGETTENPRLIAVATDCQLFSEVETLEDLPTSVLEQIEHFFISYNEQAGKEFRPTGRAGPKRAKKLMEKSLRKSRR
jgi:inorganic pyrophosphatase